MKKICVSIETEDFKKGMKDIPDDIRQETQKYIQELIDAENNFNPNDKTQNKEQKSSPRQDYGNTLASMGNRNIFSLKTKYRFRFVAVISEDEKTRSYVWFFADTHEKYNTKIMNRSKELKQKENQINNSQKIEDEKEEQLARFENQQKQKNSSHDKNSGRPQNVWNNREKVGQNIEQLRKDARMTHGKKIRNRI
jgi:hypothetical protein